MSRREEKRAAKYEAQKIRSQAAAKAAEEKQSPPGKPAPKPEEKK